MGEVSILIIVNLSNNLNSKFNFQNIPTIFPASSFNPRADADALHKAMEGFGTDEKALISILCHRTCDQRASINLAYKAGYGKVIWQQYVLHTFFFLFELVIYNLGFGVGIKERIKRFF
jgi:hypothetical protein